MRERQTVQRRDTNSRGQRDALKKAQRDAEDTERKITQLEQTIASLTSALADPELYTTGDGAASATRLGVELDEAKTALERALEAWTDATERAEALAASEGSASQPRK